jgi:hypothetical protein
MAKPASMCRRIALNNTIALGNQVSLEFSISQHAKDEALLLKFVQFFYCGYVTSLNSAGVIQYRIRNRADLANNFFPFLDKNQLLSRKSKDYEDFKRVHAITFWINQIRKKRKRQKCHLV